MKYSLEQELLIHLRLYFELVDKLKEFKKEQFELSSKLILELGKEEAIKVLESSVEYKKITAKYDHASSTLKELLGILKIIVFNNPIDKNDKRTIFREV